MFSPMTAWPTHADFAACCCKKSMPHHLTSSMNAPHYITIFERPFLVEKVTTSA